MEQLSHFEAAVLAAGMTCVYNADDWSHAQAASDAPDGANESSVPH